MTAEDINRILELIKDIEETNDSSNRNLSSTQDKGPPSEASTPSGREQEQRE